MYLKNEIILISKVRYQVHLKSLRMAGFPELTNLEDISTKGDSIVEYVENNSKFCEYVYHLKDSNSCEEALSIRNKGVTGNFYILGSTALKFFNKDTVPADVDIFFLNSPVKYRVKFGNSDLVFVKERSIESLLVGLDLPCCRMATNGLGDWWISLQCIYALITGKYYLPKYLFDYSEFKKEVCLEELSDEDNDVIAVHFYVGFHERIAKYKNRGFRAIPFEYDEILVLELWITNRLREIQNNPEDKKINYYE